MNHLRITLAVAGFVCLKLLAVQFEAAGQEKNGPKKIIDWDQEISQLASTNPAPVIKDPWRYPDFDKSFRWDDGEKRVMAKVEFISFHAAEALPYLVAHAADKEYSVTHEAGNGYWSNFTVGEMCCGIIHRSIEVRSEVMLNGLNRQSRSLVGHGPEKIKQWWSTREKRELKELQLEWLQFALELAREEQAAGEAAKDRIPELEAAVTKIKTTGSALRSTYSFRLRQP